MDVPDFRVKPKICNAVLLYTPVVASPLASLLSLPQDTHFQPKTGVPGKSIMILKHLLGYAPANLVNGLSAFAMVFAFTRLMGAENYGRYALVWAGMMVIHTMCMTWAEAAGYRFAGEAARKGDMSDHIRTTLGFNAMSAGVSVIIVFVSWALVSDPIMRDAIAWLVLFLPAMTFIQTSMEIRKARQEVMRYSAASIGKTLGGLTTGICLALVHDWGASAPIMGFAFAATIVASFEAVDLWKISKGGNFQFDRFKRYFGYGVPIALALALELCLSLGDRFLIAHFLNHAAVGAYAAGYGVADQTIRMICMWAANAGAPHLLAAWEEKGPAGLKEPGLSMSRILLLLTVPAAVGIAMVSQPLADFMVGEELREQAARIMPWIAAAGLLNGWTIYYFAESFQLGKRTGLRAWIALVPTLLNLALNIILLPRIGLMGAVYATVICYLVALILIASIGRRFAPLPIPWKDIALTAIASLAMAGVVSLMPAIGGFPELVIKAVAGIITFGAAAYVLNASGTRDIVKNRGLQPSS